MVGAHLARSFGWLAFAGAVMAIPFPFPSQGAPSHDSYLSAGLVKRAPTCNTPTNRACWTDGFDINTDYEANFPDSGVVREVGASRLCFMEHG